MNRTRPLRILRIVVLAALCTAAWSAGTPAQAAGNRETPIVKAVRKAMPAVVNLTSEKRVISSLGWSSTLNEQRINGMGSGIIIDQRGYIITNFHVVDKVTRLQAKLADGRTFDAQTVKADRKNDLALLKIDAPDPLPTISMGTSDDLMLGETVIAVGNAYGYESTVTIGVISALGRTVRLNEQLTYYDLIQTDASINPGNSGGALLNIDGDLIGLNVAIRAGAQGISFAIPVDKVRQIAAELLNIRGIDHNTHGLTCREGRNPQTGEVELAVEKAEGPAKECGLRPGDVVVRVADRPVASALDLERNLLGRKAGQPIAVVVRRAGQEQRLELRLKQLPSLEQSPSEIVWQRLGLRLSVIDPYQVRRYQPQLRGGMYVVAVKPNSAAAQAGLTEGDVLLGLEQWEVLNYDNLMFVLTQQRRRHYDAMRVHVLRGGDRYELRMPMSSDPVGSGGPFRESGLIR